MPKASFDPFMNETQSLGIDEMTVENRQDRVSIYGTLTITRDKQGLESGSALLEILQHTVNALRAATDLPDSIETIAPEFVSNPFDKP